MVKRTVDPRQLELVLVFPEPITIPPEPAFPDPGTAATLRETMDAIFVCGPNGTVLGHVVTTQVRVLSSILDRVMRDTIGISLGSADDEGSFEVILDRMKDDGKEYRNIVRCLRGEPIPTRQAA